MFRTSANWYFLNEMAKVTSPCTTYAHYFKLNGYFHCIGLWTFYPSFLFQASPSTPRGHGFLQVCTMALFSCGITACAHCWRDLMNMMVSWCNVGAASQRSSLIIIHNHSSNMNFFIYWKKEKLHFHPCKSVLWSLILQGILMTRIFLIFFVVKIPWRVSDQETDM